VPYLAYIVYLKTFAWCRWWAPWEAWATAVHGPWCTAPLASAVWLPLIIAHVDMHQPVFEVNFRQPHPNRSFHISFQVPVYKFTSSITAFTIVTW